MQLSAWSQHNHHNTAKFLVACTPNGALLYILPCFVGSISDIELTCLKNSDKTGEKPGISIMGGRGFVIRDLVEGLGMSWNISPFLERRTQLSEVKYVRNAKLIASLRTHFERAIGRIKKISILYEMLPFSLACLANQIVCVRVCVSQMVQTPLSDQRESERTKRSMPLDFIAWMTKRSSAPSSTQGLHPHTSTVWLSSSVLGQGLRERLLAVSSSLCLSGSL